MPTLFTNPVADRECAYRFLNLPTEGRLATFIILNGGVACTIFVGYATIFLLQKCTDYLFYEKAGRGESKIVEDTGPNTELR
ncbi:Protein of unknown function [Pyronema omphalodes CBS 100304]|uniref:Uncharacterized protein n=1 Tax=Pyronema omphalodes (strain CBS 100304) TaxID=1076935 RepID=U4L7P1_PYROM|nr:Protein of unknown function [Pyronema omphalodes CBS 100304]